MNTFAELAAAKFRMNRIAELSDVAIMGVLLPYNQEVPFVQLSIIGYIINSDEPLSERVLVARTIIQYRADSHIHGVTVGVAKLLLMHDMS